MIADKLIPAFYVVDLEGEVANLEFMLFSKHRIKKIYISSADFPNDVEATIAAERALDFFKQEAKVDFSGAKEERVYNPEFFPTLPKIEATLEQEQIEAIAQEQTDKAEADEQHVAVAMTHRFDDWGDFVTNKSHIEGNNFIVDMKVAVNPQSYMLEKNLEKQEHLARLHGCPTRESSPFSIH